MRAADAFDQIPDDGLRRGDHRQHQAECVCVHPGGLTHAFLRIHAIGNRPGGKHIGALG